MVKHKVIDNVFPFEIEKVLKRWEKKGYELHQVIKNIHENRYIIIMKRYFNDPLEYEKENE